MMTDPQVVFYIYTMSDERGNVIESSGSDAAVYIETKKHVFPQIENALKDAEPGQERVLRLAAKDSYGEYQAGLVIEVPRSKFKTPVEIDRTLEVVTPSGRRKVMRIVDFKPESVVLDGNHALAGINIKMRIEVVKKRPASARELSTGEVQDTSI